MAKAKKKKSGSKSKAPKSVALEKTSEDVKDTKASEETEKPEKAEKSSEKKASEKKSDKKSDKKAAEKKPSVFARIAKYFRECRSEIKKIVWPTPKATFKNVGIVLSVLLVVGLFVWLLDTGFIALFKLFMEI